MFKGNYISRGPVTFTIALLLVGFFALYQFFDISEALTELQKYHFNGKHPQPDTLNGSSETRQRLPKALIVGFNKCGTSTLRSFLTLHPNIVSPSREIRFFIDHYSKGLEWYRCQMPVSKPGQITLEKTPGYIKTSEVMKRIYDFDPGVKMLVIVRNPVTRLQSLYAHNMSFRKKSKWVSIERWLEEHSFEGQVIYAADFVTPIQEALTIFPREQFLFLSEEELEADPPSVVDQVQSFLELPPINTDGLFKFDKRKGFYCVNTRNPLFRSSGIKHQVDRTNGCMKEAKGRKHPDISEDLRRKIMKISRPYVEQLFRVISKTFKWDYY